MCPVSKRIKKHSVTKVLLRFPIYKISDITLVIKFWL
uniref:Uncharacterized protein n=1 Tax=Arundo donax TaxID=35708 RepID=A0A0A9GLB0_ARUDO